MALRFLMLMFAAYLGAVACQKDRAASNGAKDGIGASASSKTGVSRTDVAKTNDEAMSATDKSGVDDDDPEDDSAGTDAEEE